MKTPTRAASRSCACLVATAALIVVTGCAASRPRATNRVTNIEPKTQAEALTAFHALVYGAADMAGATETAWLKDVDLFHGDHDDGEADRAIARLYPSRRELALGVRDWPADLKRSALAFFKTHPEGLDGYCRDVIDSFGPPPDFTPTGLLALHSHFDELRSEALEAAQARLQRLLARAFAEGSARGLWQHLRPDWQAHQVSAGCHDALREAALRYARWHPDWPLPATDVLVDPLMGRGDGVCITIGPSSMLLLCGPCPTRESEDQLVTHELLHQVISALERRSSKLSAAIDASASAFDVVQNDNLSLSYSSWNAYLDETVVDCLACRVTGMPLGSTLFIYKPLVLRRLEDFEASKDDLETFLLRLLPEIQKESVRMAPFRHAKQVVRAIVNKGVDAGSRPALEKIVASVPDCLDGWYWLGVSAIDGDDWVAAQAAFARILGDLTKAREQGEWLPAWTYYKVGKVDLEQGRRADAVAAFEQAIALAGADRDDALLAWAREELEKLGQAPPGPSRSAHADGSELAPSAQPPPQR